MIEAISISNTGLDASQDSLDTAGNNLANLNTTGFKANRVLFQDLLYITLQAAGPLAPVGTQLGAGVQLSSTDKLFSEGERKKGRVSKASTPDLFTSPN